MAVTLAGVLASGFATDVIGIHAIFGAFVFGLTVPKDGEFAGRVTERVEDLVSELLLPLYFASSGLKTDVAAIRGGLAWAMLALVIGTACAGKIAGTFLAARESVVLGVVMNTKGLVELIVLNIGRERKVRACLVHQQLSLLLLCFLLFCLRKEQTKKGHADACEDKERKQSSPGSRPATADFLCSYFS